MVKLTLGTYAAGTLIAFAATIVFAFQTRRQFYPAMVFLSSSTPAVMVLLNTLGLMVIASGKLVQFVFLGQLSSMEVQAVKDNAKYAFIETCLALTVFREELGFYAFSLFVLLFFSKVFHWIAVPRVESFGWRENASFWLHFRTWSLIGFLCLTDIMFSFTFARSIYLKKGPMFLMLFGFEYTILLFSIINLAFKYWILIQDLRLNGQWEMKSLYTFYVDIASDVIRLLLYLAFFSLISMNFGIPLHLLREVYVALHTLRQRLGRYFRYRALIRNLHEQFPSASEEELDNADRSCIICRDTMDQGKKLPCGHVFHFHCLRSWIERSNTCPTCRAVIPSRQNPPVQPQNEPVVQQFDAPPLAPEHIEERANAPLEDARNPERRNDPYQNTEFQARRFHPQPGYPASFAQRFHHHGPTNSTLRRNSSLSTSSGNRMHTRPIQKDERIIKKSEKSQSTALLLQEQTLMTLQQIEFHQQALERLKNHYCTLLSLQEAAYHESQTAAFTSEASSSSQDPDPSQEIGNLESQDASATATSNSTSSSQDMGNPTGVINPTQTTEESQESRSSNDGIRRRVSSQQ